MAKITPKKESVLIPAISIALTVVSIVVTVSLFLTDALTKRDFICSIVQVDPEGQKVLLHCR